MYCVYILQLSNKQLYTGFTTDLRRRLAEHRRGHVHSTRRRLPIRLIHCEAYLLEVDARRREQFLKTSDGKRFLKQQLAEFFRQNILMRP